MNKVFKVIWSEARNAYVVVSEMAKSHGTKSCSTKKLLAMLIATGIMTCASAAPVMAEDAVNLAPDATKIAIGEGAVASGKGSVVAIGQKASASGEGSVAIGEEAVASGLVGIAIGRDAVASGADSIAIGSDTKATQTFSVAVGNDIGFTAYAGTAVGQQAYASGKEATAIGTMTNVNDDDKWTEANPGQRRNAGEQSTAIGAYACSWGLHSTAVGGFSKAEGEMATAIGHSSQANVNYGTALGAYSEVTAGWGVAIGASSVADRKSRVVGLYAPDEDKNSLTWKANAGAVSVGSSVEGEEITRQITNVAAGSADTDAVNVAQLNAVKAAAGKKVSLVDGENTKATLVKDDATGTQYKVDVDLSKYAKTEDVAVVYDKNKTSLRSTNATLQTSSGKEEAVDSIALGNGASAVKGSVAIGNGASVVEGSNGLGGVALGYKAHAGYKGTSLGSNAISGREGTTLVGANTNSGSLYTTVVGTDSVISSDGTEYKILSKTINVQGAMATAYGAYNNVVNNNKKVFSGVSNSVIGSVNTVKNSNGVTIQGTGNTVTDAYKDMEITYWDLLKFKDGNYSSLGEKESGAVAVVGGANTVSKQTDSTVIGYDNRLIGGEENISHDVFMAGSHNRLNNVSDSIVMGNKNTIEGVSNVISFGHDNKIKASNAVAIGNGAGVSVEGGVALGVGSVASTAANALGYGAAEGETGIAWKATNGAVSVGSSVEGKKITRQITNVAAGTEDTDAVNVAQLKKVSEAAASASQGWKLKTKNGNASDVKPGATVEFDGDDNIVVSNTGNNVVVKLGKELTGLTSVTTNNAYVTNVDASKNESVTNVEYVKNQIADAALSAGDGISITDKKINVKLKEGEQNLVVNQDGLSLNTTLNGMEAINGVGGGKISFSGGNVTINNNVTFNKDGRIQNVTAGTENTDAVNYGQLKDYVAANDTHIKGGDYAVGEVTDNAGNKSQGVSMDIVNKEGNVTGTVTITDVAKASDVGNVTNINNDLKNPNGTTTVVDAVNNLNQKLDKKVGDLNYVEGGAETKGNYVTNGESTTVSIGKLDQALKDVATTAAKHTTVSGSSNIVVEPPTTNTDGGKNYNVKLADEITVNSVTANTFTAGQTVVMNKDGLMVGNKVSVSATAVTAGKTSISDEGVKVDGKTYISADGLNANNNKITNVVDGTVEKDSKDAINGGQLHQAKADINNRIDGVENQVISNSNRIGQLSSRVNKVGAGAAALAALHPMDFDPDDKLTFSAGYGNYGGENAAAIGAYYRPDEKVMFSVGGTVGNGENMVNAGISFALDRTNHVSNSRTALAREVIDLRGQLAEMGAKMAKMEKAFGMLDESKTKLFPDIPANHWAYEYIAKLAGNGYIEGYPDGNFGGDRLMTRYEFAAMLYHAIENGAALEERIIKEFEPELGRIRVDRISGEDGDRNKIERVRVNDTKGERDHYGNKLAK